MKDARDLIYDKVKTWILSADFSAESLSLFLCGGAKHNKNSMRDEVRCVIESSNRRKRIRVYYPEELFFESIYGHPRRDLLALENLLAKSVNAVAIIVESPGTLVELGAFTNVSVLANRLIVILNEKYRHDKSFVNYGPLRKLRQEYGNDSHVFFYDLDAEPISKVAEYIVRSTRQISQKSQHVPSMDSPITASLVLLALIYIMDPSSKEDMYKIIKTNDTSIDGLDDVLNTSITYLHNEGLVVTSNGLISSTVKGNLELREIVAGKRATLSLNALLHDCRTIYLNYSLRGSHKFSQQRRPSLSMS